MKIVVRAKTYFKKLKKSPRFSLKIFLVLLHGTWLLFLTLVLQYFTLTRSDETSFLKWMSIWKHNILNIDTKPFDSSVIFIDVSKDIMLIPDSNAPYDALPPFKGPEQQITDRSKLAALFSHLNKHPEGYKYILCDILFEDYSPEDSILKKEIEQLKRIIISAELDKESGELIKPIFNVQFGIANYDPVNQSSFSKSPVMYKDTLKNVSALLYEKISGNKISKSGGIVFINDRPIFNTIIPEFYYRSTNEITRANTYYLGELLLEGEDVFEEQLKNKYIIIGDFSMEKDRHSTFIGSMPGALIWWNTFLTLMQRPMIITWQWLLLLWVIYASISYWMFFHPEKKMKDLHKKIRLPVMQGLVLKYISYAGILIILDFISFLFFGTFISLFYLATYLTFLELVISKWNEWMIKLSRILNWFKTKKTK